MTGCSNYLVLAHELGHNFGMHHSTVDYENDGTIDSEYGDSTCPMGSAFDYAMFNAAHQYDLGWFDNYPSSVTTVTQSGVYNIAPLEADPGNISLPQLMRFAVDGEDYYFSYRYNLGNYELPWYLADRLSIHRSAGGLGQKPRLLGDMAVGEGQTFTDTASGLMICVHDSNASALNFSIALGGESCAVASDDSDVGESDAPVPGDSDGDGVTDSQEASDGTDPNDPGSYLERLTSPVYTLWNSFLGMTNILELINPEGSGGSNTQINIKLYSIDGNLVYNGNLTLEPSQQFDTILNALPGFISESYGIVKITYTGTLVGRLSYYLNESDSDGYKFAYSVPLSRPLREETAVSFDTRQPSTNVNEAGYQQLNWLTIVNFAANSKEFTIKSYDSDGELLETRSTMVSGFGRVDLDGGHVLAGQGAVGQHVITPTDLDSPYSAQLVRFGTDALEGAAVDNYVFSFPFGAHAGNGRTTYLPISRQFSETNRIEIINTSDSSVDVELTFYDANGSEQSEEIFLDAFAQEEFSIDSTYLEDGERGYVRIVPDEENSVIAQSLFFHLDANGSVSAMSAVSAREALGESSLSSYNLFLGMQNWLTISNTTDEDVSIEIDATSYASNGSQTLEIEANSSLSLAIHGSEALGTLSDTYGILEIDPDQDPSLILDLHRVRYEEDGITIDYSFPTAVRPQ